MNFLDILNTPFPRPEKSRRNLYWLLLVGCGSSLFIILYKPFGIQNVYGQWYYNLIIFSLGMLFIGTVALVEWGISSLFPKYFNKWVVGKAIIWYALMILFVGAVMFLFKSYLGGFNDFTLTEYFFVSGRVLVITLTVSFFGMGIYQYIRSGKISRITKGEDYLIIPQNGQPLQLKLSNILYVNSNDNYVDIHLLTEGIRKKVLVRSSLKNVEDQIVNPISPIYRCHRGYLINIEYFQITKAASRSMTLSLHDYPDEVPVSKQYVNKLKQLLSTRP